MGTWPTVLIDCNPAFKNFSIRSISAGVPVVPAQVFNAVSAEKVLAGGGRRVSQIPESICRLQRGLAL
jgi:hypothetical protein